MKKNKTQEKKEPEITTKKVKKKKSGLKLTFIVIILAIIIGCIGALVYTLKFASKTIDLSEYLNIEYEGFNGNATATIEIDNKSLSDKIDSSIAKKLVKKAELEIENNENLSNGDELKVKISIPSKFLEENKLKLKDTKIKITVEGLEDTSKIDLSKYITLEYEGYNKYATAKASFDEKALKKDFDSSIAKEFIDQASLSIKNNSKLENNKDVEINISIPDSWLKKNGLELKSNTIKIKVEGLKEATEIDGFSGMKVDITGMSPNLNLSVSNTSTDEFIKTIIYTPEKTSGISNNDTVKINITSFDEKMAKEKGYVLKETSTNYKVENQAAYVYNLSEITPDVKEQIKSSYIEKAKAKATEIDWGDERAKEKIRYYTDYTYVDLGDSNINQDLSIGNPEITALYLLTNKDNSKTYLDTNKIIGIIKIPYTSNINGVTYNWYITVTGSNFSLKSDGSISDNTVYESTTEYGESQEKAYSTYLDSQKSNYNVESIPLN